jgi:hypothetical protein
MQNKKNSESEFKGLTLDIEDIRLVPLNKKVAEEERVCIIDILGED